MVFTSICVLAARATEADGPARKTDARPVVRSLVSITWLLLTGTATVSLRTHVPTHLSR